VDSGSGTRQICRPEASATVHVASPWVEWTLPSHSC
jgi:hypothetical protein